MVFFINKQVSESAGEHQLKLGVAGIAVIGVMGGLIWGAIDQLKTTPAHVDEASIGFTLESLAVAEQAIKEIPQAPTPVEIPTPVETPQATPTPAPSPQVSKESAPTPQADPYQGMRQLKIADCNGAEKDGANIRSSPNLADSSIVGVAPTGSVVYLTGQTFTDELGNQFLAVINPAPLLASANANAQTYLASNQRAWMHNCFVH